MTDNSNQKRLGNNEESLILPLPLACLAVCLCLHTHETLSNTVNLYYSPNLFHVPSHNVKVKNAIKL